MTEPGDRHVTQPAGPAISAICPYLMAADGRWRATFATRDHRCTAVQPATILAADKQRRLCLVDEHRTCSTYLAAAGLAGPDGSTVHVGALARPLARTTPVLYDHGRLAFAASSLAGARGVGQGSLVALMAVAFGALVAARLSGGGPELQPTVGGGVTASPGATSGSGPSTPSAEPPATPQRTLVPSEVEPTPVPTGGPAATPGPTAEPTSDPGASPAPTTYTVARGDSLSGIAARYGTTWQVLAELNDIADPRSLRVGQVLQLP